MTKLTRSVIAARRKAIIRDALIKQLRANLEEMEALGYDTGDSFALIEKLRAELTVH